MTPATGHTMQIGAIAHGSDLAGGMSQPKRDGFQAVSASYRTTDWRPTCDCIGLGPNAANYPVPCRVLDPFCGSGTTGVVACGLWRDFTGIELNPEYARMAERRIGRELRPSTYASDAPTDSPLFVTTPETHP